MEKPGTKTKPATRTIREHQAREKLIETLDLMDCARWYMVLPHPTLLTDVVILSGQDFLPQMH